MRRGLWFAAGAASSVYVMVRARRAAEVFTPDGLADRLHAWRLGAQLVRDEVAQGRTEAEIHLRERLGVAHPDHPLALTSRPASSPDAPQEEGSN